MIHELKIESAHFEAVKERIKSFEIRYNDRGYQKGDSVRLKEYVNSHYTGNNRLVKILYVTAFQQKENWVVFGFEVMK